MLQLLQPKIRSSNTSVVELQLMASYKNKTHEIEQELLSTQIKREFAKLDKEKTGSLSQTEIVDFFVSKGMDQKAGIELFNSVPVE